MHYFQPTTSSGCGVLWVNVELLHVINYEINVFTLLQVGCNLLAADQG